MPSFFKQTFSRWLTGLVLICLTVQLVAADSSRIDPTGAPGKLVIGGGGNLPPLGPEHAYLSLAACGIRACRNPA